MSLARVSNTTFPLPRNVATPAKPSDSKALRSTFILTIRSGPALRARRNAKSWGIFGSKRPRVEALSLLAVPWARVFEFVIEGCGVVHHLTYHEQPQSALGNDRR